MGQFIMFGVSELFIFGRLCGTCCKLFAISVDPDQTPHSVVSDLDWHWFKGRLAVMGKLQDTPAKHSAYIQALMAMVNKHLRSRYCGVLLIGIQTGQGLVVLAAGAGWGCFDFFNLVCPFFVYSLCLSWLPFLHLLSLSLSLSGTARYRLKYYMTELLTPAKQTRFCCPFLPYIVSLPSIKHDKLLTMVKKRKLMWFANYLKSFGLDNSTGESERKEKNGSGKTI